MPMPSRPCKYCGSLSHWPFQCYKRPRPARKTPRVHTPRIRHESVKTKAKRLAVRAQWFELNPPDARGQWECYLRISPLCLVKVDISTLNQEHVKGEARHPKHRYDVANIRAGCPPCNKLKGSLDLEDLVDEFPHLRQYL